MTQHNANNPDLDTRRRRAFYRAHHRGTQEMDLLLGRYGAAKLDGMNAAQLDVFERVLDQPDPDLQRRLMAPAVQDTNKGAVSDAEALIEDIRAFHGLASIGGKITNKPADEPANEPAGQPVKQTADQQE